MEKVMSDSSSSQAGGGIGFLGLLTIVFITLRLCGVIKWSWWLVLAPIWAPVAMCLAFAAFCFAMAVIVRVYEAVK